jgi:peptide/nickel transport system substrate-binding protein
MNRKAISRTATIVIVVVIVIILVGSAAAAVILMRGPSTSSTTSTYSTGTGANTGNYTFASSLQPTGSDADPVTASGNINRQIIQNVLDGLVWYPNATLGQPAPLLADSWTISSNGLTYSFHLRNGVNFSDGNPVRPIDVWYSFARFFAYSNTNGYVGLLEPELTGYTPGHYVPLANISSAITIVNSSNTVTFHLLTPDAAFLSNLAQPYFGILEASYAEVHGSWIPGQNVTGTTDSKMGSGQNLIGSGPFTLTVDNTQKIILTRNPHYWRGPAKIQTMTIVYVPEWSTRLLLLQNDQVQGADITPDVAGQVEGNPLYNLYNASSGFTEAIFFNFNLSLSSQPAGTAGITANVMSDIHMRLGFAYAFNYNQYVQQAYLGFAQHAIGYLPPGEFGYYPTFPYQYNLTAATQQFKEAWGGSIWSNGFTMAFGYQSFQSGAGQIAGQLLAQALQSINPKFHLIVQQTNWPTLLGWPLFLAVDNNGPDPSWYGDVYGSSGTFPSLDHYNNATVNSLLTQGLSQTNSSERASIYNQLGLVLKQDVPTILTVYYPALVVLRSNLHGYVYNAAWLMDAGYGWYISLS